MAGLLLAGGAHAASKDVHYGPAPNWVEPPPAPTSLEPPAGAPLRVVYLDTQIRVTRDAEESHSAYRIKVLKPEALGIGNLTATWNPSTDEITVNGLKIVRDGKTIDVLAQTKFRVIERENGLDYAMLDGALTASLQAPGLQVGDELEFAITILRRDATFGGRASDISQLPVAGAPGAFRARLRWDKGVALQWRATPDLGTLAVQSKGAEQALVAELRDPSSALLTDGAPPRFNMRRVMMFSTFDSWSHLSNLFAALFERAAVLAPDSPLRAEAAKIAASTPDPKLRAEAALRLVQDRIRYVFVGLNGGAYRPAPADETWRRRFGDCKAKTVLLMALLRELGVESEAVLVNSTGGDLTPKLLPTPMAFDHVLVRATIAGRPYWLDGTRSGDRRLEAAPSPTSRWGLPIRQSAADIEAIPPESLTLPQLSVVLDIDATAGFDDAAKVKSEEVLRGDGVQALRTQLSAMSPEDAQRAVKGQFHNEYDWADADTGAWRYDEAQQALILTAIGTGKPNWEGDAKDGRTLDLMNAGFTPPDRLHRPKEQDQTVPWLTNFPRFRRWTTIVRLPPPDPGKHWEYSAKPVDTRLGGVAYWREAQLSRGVMRTTMSVRTYLPELSPTQAKEIEDRLPTFDNKVSQVFETDNDAAEATPAKAAPAAAKDVKALTDAGVKAVRDRHFDDALTSFDRALAIDPKFAPALAGKLNALAGNSEYAKALAVLEAIVAADPKADLSLERASLLYAAGRTEAGSKTIDGWLAAEPNEWGVLFAAAQVEAQAGLFDRAIAHVDAGLKLEPEKFQLLRLRALIEQRDGNLRGALTDADAVIRLRPEERGAFIDRGKILVELKRLDEALADLDEAWRIDPFDGAVDVTRGTILTRLGRPAEAMAMYDDVLARSATATAANAVCWDLGLANVDLTRAEAICAKAIRDEPDNASFWDSYALVALRDGRLDAARTRYDHALSLDPRLAPSLYARGIVKIRQGDKAAGGTDIAAAKALDANAGRELTDAGLTP